MDSTPKKRLSEVVNAGSANDSKGLQSFDNMLIMHLTPPRSETLTYNPKIITFICHALSPGFHRFERCAEIAAYKSEKQFSVLVGQIVSDATDF